jgi:hypothetical protein
MPGGCLTETRIRFRKKRPSSGWILKTKGARDNDERQGTGGGTDGLGVGDSWNLDNGLRGTATSSSEATTLSTPHAVAPKGLSGLSAVSCPDVDHCVAVGAATGSTQKKIIPGATSTVNGGASWSKGTLQGGPTQVEGVSCATNKHCVGVGGDITTSFAGTDVAGVIVTNDGGLSWTGHLLMVSLPVSRARRAVDASLSERTRPHRASLGHYPMLRSSLYRRTVGRHGSPGRYQTGPARWKVCRARRSTSV